MSGLFEPTLYMVKGMVILDSDGNRILAKYYDEVAFPSVKEEKKFEKQLFSRSNSEITMINRMVCVHKSNVDLYFYVIGSAQENELILHHVLTCLYEAVSFILRKNVEKRSLMDNLDIIMLTFDEICDGGIILEGDAAKVSRAVALKIEEQGPFTDQTVTQVLQSAREQLKWSLLK